MSVGSKTVHPKVLDAAASPVICKPVRSPIRWVGGKSRLRKHIRALMPPHTGYAEPFCGGAWVFFATPPAREGEILNDIDLELINFYRVIQNQPETFISAFEGELVARATFNRLRDQDPAALDDVARAHRFFYLLMAGWGGEMGYPRFVVSTNDRGGGNRLIGAIQSLEKRIRTASGRLQGVVLQSQSWEVFFAQFDQGRQFGFCGGDMLMYIDPPYPNNKCNYRYNMRSWEEHERLADCIRRQSCKWILSLPNHPMVHRLYAGFWFTPVSFASGMKKKKTGRERVTNREVLITNFPPYCRDCQSCRFAEQESCVFRAKA